MQYSTAVFLPFVQQANILLSSMAIDMNNSFVHDLFNGTDCAKSVAGM